jgi:phosphatidylglycerol---prolipoprotein diacylglyceryl transferase
LDPIAFEIFGIEVRWYGIILASAILLCAYLGVRRARRLGYDGEAVIDLALFAVPAAIAGARIWYVAFNWSYYSGDIFKMINIREGGLAIHGGIAASLLTAFIFCRIRKIDFLILADMLIPFLALGQSIGRWGNYMNSEAYGGPTDLPWGIMIDGVKVHPTFLYESIADFAIFAVLYGLLVKKRFDGQILCLYLIMYSVPRFFIEGMRTDSLMFLGMRTAQLTSLAMILIGLAGMLGGHLIQRKKRLDK